jgi:hypothetical protein
MGGNLGLRSENNIYPLEFVEYWSTGVLDGNIWTRNGTGTAIMQVINGHMGCNVEGLNGSDVSLATILGFNVVPSVANWLYADNLNKGWNMVKKLTVEFMANLLLANDGTIEMGFNDLNTNVLGNDALLFRFISIGNIQRCVIRDTAVEHTNDPATLQLGGLYKIEITRNSVSFYFQNELVWKYSNPANLPNDFMYFWVRCQTSGAGDQANCILYPIWIRYELVK